MKEQKIKRYRLGVSKTFPSTHHRKGEETYFVVKIMSALGKFNDEIGNATRASQIIPKLHTIRNNYELWVKRMVEVQAGRAVIEIYYWDGKPRHKGSKQVVFAVLDKDSGCGVQELNFPIKIRDWSDALVYESFSYKFTVPISTLAKNDGLSLDDFRSWFKNYDLSTPKAIIQFTNFRY